MSLSFNGDGSYTFTSDADGTTTSTLPAGHTSAEVSAAYAAFKLTWPLPWLKAEKQQALDDLLDASAGLAGIIRAGTVTTVTGAQAGTLVAGLTNNYRSLKAAIASAANATVLNAININAGWPANP
jgi:hypothetical protein